MSSYEVGNLMLKLGAKDALMLDGGDSATLFVKSEERFGVGRTVADGLLVYMH